MLHLLDASTLITANREYYPLDRIPEFWDWLLHQGAQGQLKIPLEMVEEIREGTDEVAAWISERDHLEALTLEEDVDVDLLRRVIEEGYAPDLTDQEIEIIGRDPFLISHALKSPDQRCVVTAEISKPSKQRANRKVPDVCNDFGIRPMDSFGLIRSLNFSTAWRAAAGV
ncbi:DUF4411 family protein [Bradyrhizobium japonicum]|uniref:DUF4411 family protein n=1 Tax=Bradyrhizobium japonicum TaxID=375 RepID=UPI001BA881EE|nr:DUF4411 family protein [Bradyrhizobium japonicum]MBR0747363.1 DUF4411 family protein [Bradyrhizobium japonicum]